VVAIVRACEPTYDKAPLAEAGIRVLEMPFQDGSPPPDSMIAHWLALVHEVFGPPGQKKDKESKKSSREKDAASATAVASASTPTSTKTHSIAVAGLGRAPVLVCIALMESGMSWMAAVELVRRKRRGALNITQLQYLETYKPTGKKDSCTSSLALLLASALHRRL
jgi:protein tyrosine phosphatase type 4A